MNNSFNTKFCDCCGKELMAIGSNQYFCTDCDNNICQKCKKEPIKIPFGIFQIEKFDPQNKKHCEKLQCNECINYYKIVENGFYNVCFNPEKVDRAISIHFEICIRNLLNVNKEGRKDSG
jgi:hypothetical protein